MATNKNKPIYKGNIDDVIANICDNYPKNDSDHLFYVRGDINSNFLTLSSAGSADAIALSFAVACSKEHLRGDIMRYILQRAIELYKEIENHNEPIKITEIN